MRSLLRKHSATAIAGLGFAMLAGSADAATIYIDYGDSATTTTNPTYNNQGSGTTNATLTNLVDSTGAATGIQSVAAGFGGFGSAGKNDVGLSGAAATAFGALPAGNTVQVDYIFTQGAGTFTFSGLSTNSTYTFTAYGNRNGAANRTTQFTATGQNTATGSHETAFNVTDTTVLSNIVPTAAGTITLGVTLGTGNNQGFAYLNALRIDSAANPSVPEPASLGVLAGGAAMLLRRRRV